MILNFSDDEYSRLCRIADHYGTKPAWLLKRYVEEKMALEEWLLSRNVDGVGVRDGMGTPLPHPQPPSLPVHES